MRSCSIPGCGRKHEARGWCEMHYARWKRLGSPTALVTAPRGEAINAHGYRSFANKLEHIAIVEHSIGKPLPINAVVHHVDYNRINNTHTNLVVCTRSYHMLIHQRTDALNACGNANWRRCNICKTYDSPQNLYIKGSGAYHRECKRNRRREQRGASFDNGWVITAHGISLNLHEWAAKTGINRATIATRIKELGWSAEDAISTPARKLKKALQEGFVIPGARLARTTRIEIK